jgi:hypothetical protein
MSSIYWSSCQCFCGCSEGLGPFATPPRGHVVCGPCDDGECQQKEETQQPKPDPNLCACSHAKPRHYWTRRGSETVHLCRDCRECLGFERPDPELGFTVEEINKRWEYDRQSEINRTAAVHLEPLREALRIKSVNFMLDAVFAPGRRTGEQ